MTAAYVHPSQCSKIAGVQESRFKGNLGILLKQGIHYAASYKTRYISFFDWDHLVLLYMGDQERLSGGVYCCMTVTRNKHLMRKALLAFLERAYQAATRGEDSLPPIVPAVDEDAIVSIRRRRG